MSSSKNKKRTVSFDHKMRQQKKWRTYSYYILGTITIVLLILVVLVERGIVKWYRKVGYFGRGSSNLVFLVITGNHRSYSMFTVSDFLTYLGVSLAAKAAKAGLSAVSFLSRSRRDYSRRDGTKKDAAAIPHVFGILISLLQFRQLYECFISTWHQSGI